MSHSRPSSRPVSRSNSISEAPISIPVDPRIHASQHQGHQTHHKEKEHHHRHHHNEQDAKLFGPGFSSAAPNTAAGQYRYVLVTPEMMAAIESGTAPQTTLVHPAGTELRSHAASHYQSHGLSRNHGSKSRPSTPPASHVGDPMEVSLKASDPTTMYKSEKGEVGQMNELSLKQDGVSSCDSADHMDFPNPWARIRHPMKEYFAEFIGTCVLILFGNGVNCQVVLSELTQGNYLSISHGWGVGVLGGVYIAGGISGAHINPAVTIPLAIFRGFPWRKVPGYCLAQILGACFGSCLIQGNYHALLNQYEGGYNLRTFTGPNATATLFFTGTKDYMSNIGAFCSEVLATCVLLALIMSLGDANNNPAPAGMNGVILFFIILGIGASLGTETAYCLNPARDLGPRIAAAMYGYPSTIWTDRNCYFIYVPIIATIVGGCLGCFVYDLLIYTGPESPVNSRWELPWSSRSRKNRQAAEIEA